MTEITPEIQALIDAQVEQKLAVRALDGEVGLFDALDKLKPEADGLDESALQAVRSRLAQEEDGGLSLLHRYLHQRYLHDEQTDHDHTDAQAYLDANQAPLGVDGDVLATPLAGPAQDAGHIVGVAGTGVDL